jgi:hypothetical protein
MPSPSLSPLHRQLTRVGRRLFLQTFLGRLFGCWAGALALAAAWFVAQPHLFPALAPEWRLAVAGGLVGVATILAVALAILQAPSKITAALLLDEKFGLKERVTTSLTLDPRQEESPAAQALLADVNQRVGQLDVGSRFPVRVSWLGALVPTCAAVLAVLAFSYQPAPTQAKPSAAEDLKQPAANAAEIKEKIDKLKRKEAERKVATRVKPEDLKRIEAELEKIANKPHETKEQLRERIKEMTALEDAIKNQEKDLADKSRALQQQLQQMESLAKDGSQDGPAKDFQKALSEGKLDQAKEELEKLAKKMQNNELSRKEKEQLAKQLEDIQKKLERQAQQKDKEEQLKQRAREGKLDAETLKRELDQLKKDNEKLKDLQNLANKVGRCQQCLKKGDGKGASQSLQEASDQLKDMEGQDQDLEDLREQLQKLQDAKDSC